MSGRQIVVDILGDASKFSGATKSATASAGAFSNVLKGVGAGIGIGFTNVVANAGTTLVNFFGDAVKAGMEEEQSIARLGAALRANVADWDGVTAGIEDTLKARIKLGFSDDEQRDSLARLVVATKDSAAALDIQRTAMDLARLKNISLADASDALIKVESGQYRALKSLGIVLKDGATQTDALAAVQAAANGQAEAYAQTTGGKLLVAQTLWGEKVDELGTSLLPIATDALTGFIDTLDKLPKVEAVGDWWDEMTAGIQEFIDTLPKVEKPAKQFSQAAKDASMIAFRAGERIQGSSEETKDEVVRDNRRMVLSYGSIGEYLLGKYNEDFDRAMGIQEARAELHTAKTDQEKAQAYATLKELGALNERDYDRWLAALERLAASTKGKVHDAYAAALADILALRAAARTPINVDVNYRKKGQPPGGWGGQAAGGRYGAGEAFWVGEEGPELRVESAPGFTLSHRDAMAAVSGSGKGGGGASVNVNIYGSVVGVSGVEELSDIIARRLRLDGV